MRKNPAKIRRRANFFIKKCLIYIFVIGIIFFALVGISKLLPHPTMRVLSPLVVERKNSSQSANLSFQVINLLEKNSIAFQNVSIASDSSILIKMQNGSEVLLSSQKKLDEEIASLQLTIAHLTIEGKSFSRLDFRFDRPIISF